MVIVSQPWNGGTAGTDSNGRRGDVQRSIFANRDLAWASGGWNSTGKAMAKAMGKHRHFMGKP